jgi:predicted DNA-binding protein (MmcQ/YjbR family)
MDHPVLFGEDDAVVERMRGLCMVYPEAAEVRAWGRPTFRAGKKIFVTVGASMNRPYSMVFKPDPDEYPALVQRNEIFVPPYFGPSGWLAIDLIGSIEWRLVEELVDESYRQVALKRQLKALDAS